MRVLVACEYSGRVRDAFRCHGHFAMSCDLLECEADSEFHYQGPVQDIINDGWDLMVAHPPCTHLAVSGSRHFHRKQRQQAEALDFVRFLMNSPIERWCIENPVSIISSAIRPPDQIIQPWEYGHGETNMMPPGPDRWKERSRTFTGIAEAMGDQWGNRVLPLAVNQLSLLAD